MNGGAGAREAGRAGHSGRLGERWPAPQRAAASGDTSQLGPAGLRGGREAASSLGICRITPAQELWPTCGHHQRAPAEGTRTRPQLSQRHGPAARVPTVKGPSASSYHLGSRGAGGGSSHLRGLCPLATKHPLCRVSTIWTHPPGWQGLAWATSPSCGRALPISSLLDASQGGGWRSGLIRGSQAFQEPPSSREQRPRPPPQPDS